MSLSCVLFLMVSVLATAGKRIKCAKGNLRKPFMMEVVKLGDYDYPKSAVAVYCSMTFQYNAGFCRDGGHVTKIETGYAQFGSKKDLRTAAKGKNIFNSNLNRRELWTQIYLKYNEDLVRPNRTEEDMIDQCLFDEFPIEYVEGEKYVPEEEEKKTEEKETEQKSEEEDDPAVFYVTLIGGVVPLVMLGISCILFQSWESKRRSRLLNYSKRSREEEDEDYGTEGRPREDELDTSKNLAPARQPSAEASLIGPKEGQRDVSLIGPREGDRGASFIGPKEVVHEGHRPRDEGPPSREGIPLSFESLPPLPGEPRPSNKTSSLEPLDDGGYESIDPLAAEHAVEAANKEPIPPPPPPPPPKGMPPRSGAKPIPKAVPQVKQKSKISGKKRKKSGKKADTKKQPKAPGKRRK
ncbi:unnamed protein product [Haemonchus placei]|uniref:Uncharacterized protein n=1 Tax=Haemonchus placei TaxID=6290 RepID=A0A0N4WQJ3_HAEPC|nr:unnamed protein product [Haemonchus placei]